MRLKENKLFVRRSASISRRLYRNFAFNRNRNVPLADVHTVSNIFSTEPGEKLTTLNMGYDELRKKSDEKPLHNQLKPLILMLKLLGCFPVEMSKSGVLTFRALSPIMAYSVCLYALVNTATYSGVRYKIIPFFQKDDELENRVYIAMLLVLDLSFLYVPVFTWLDAPKAVQYFEEWKQFQEMFIRVTKEHIMFNVRRWSTLRIVFAHCASFSAYFFVCYPPYLEFWQTISLQMASLLIHKTAVLWRCFTRSLSISARDLNKCFKRDMKQRNFSADLLEQYRILWLRWSHLVSQTGCAMEKVIVFGFILLLFVITIALFASLYEIKENELTSQRMFFMTTTFLGFVGALYHVCEEGHYISNVLGVEIRDQLQLISPAKVPRDVSEEVSLFLDTIATNPPALTLANFANIDRGLFRAYASTIVTYMIVLVQFDQSDHSSDRCRENETHHSA